ncbi:hypothetical protein ACXIZN_11740 [Amycolatopsis sp. TRM77291]
MSSDAQYRNAERLLQGVTLIRVARQSLARETAAAVREDPELREALYEWFKRDWQMVRILYLIAVGYSGTPTFYRATTSTDQREASLFGMIEFHSGSRVYVLTPQGRSALDRWTELMEWLKEHPRFADLWARVTVV